MNDRTIDTGGPAFPVHPEIREDEAHAGMSLRDHYAGLAMQQLLSICQGDTHDGATYPAHVARLSFEMADAMVKARGGAQ